MTINPSQPQGFEVLIPNLGEGVEQEVRARAASYLESVVRLEGVKIAPGLLPIAEELWSQWEGDIFRPLILANRLSYDRDNRGVKSEMDLPVTTAGGYTASRRFGVYFKSDDGASADQGFLGTFGAYIDEHTRHDRLRFQIQDADSPGTVLLRSGDKTTDAGFVVPRDGYAKEEVVLATTRRRFRQDLVLRGLTADRDELLAASLAQLRAASTSAKPRAASFTVSDSSKVLLEGRIANPERERLRIQLPEYAISSAVGNLSGRQLQRVADYEVTFEQIVEDILGTWIPDAVKQAEKELDAARTFHDFLTSSEVFKQIVEVD